MRYFFIDGYNLLFHWSDEEPSLQIRRNQLIQWIQHIDLQGVIVFDGSHRSDEEYGLAYASPMDVAFTPKGQTADQYILELIEISPHRKCLVVVTNDQSLKRHATGFGANTLSSQAFLHWAMKRKKRKKAKKPAAQESKSQVERWVKIFEERLKQNLDDNF